MKPCHCTTVFGLVLILGIILDLPSAYGDHANYLVLRQRRAWVDADTDCRSRQGRLLILDTHSKVMDFRSQVTLERDETYWSAAYRKSSPWLWIEGCFSANGLRETPTRISQNHSPTCASSCPESEYAGLKGNLCYCLDGIHELTPLDARKCSTPCDGSPTEMCGGQGAVTLYSMGGVTGFKEDSRADWKNCVYILKHDTAVWVTSDCAKPMPFLCKIYRENGAITEYTSPPELIGSWGDARAICHERGGTLADLHSRNLEAVSALPKESEYWVGLYRNTSWSWHTGEEAIPHPTWCTAFKEDDNGQLQFETTTCSLPFNYVCEIPEKSPLAAADSSHLEVFVAVGTSAWVLATIAIIVLVYLIRKRKCRRANTGTLDTLRTLGTSYADLHEGSSGSSTIRSHSYVNGGASCSTSRETSSGASCDRSSKQSQGQSQGQCEDAGCSNSSPPDSPRYYTINGNEYATVMLAGNEKNRSGACAKSAKRTSGGEEDGDYDLVWDSLRYKNQNHHASDGNICSSDGQPGSAVYAQVSKGSAEGASLAKDHPGNDYVTVPSKLFPMDNKRGEDSTSGKNQLGRMRSVSL